MRKYKTKTTKYEYWKWVILERYTQKITPKDNKNIVAVYDQMNNKIFRYDIEKKKKISTDWNGIDWLFNNYLANLLTIDELKNFYLSLPKELKHSFWKHLW